MREVGRAPPPAPCRAAGVRGRRTYERATRLLSALLVVVGSAQIVLAVARGAGPTAYVLGALFVAVGAGRLWLSRRRLP